MNISTKDRIVRTIASPGCKRGTVVYGAINMEINSPNWRRRPAENDECIKPHIPSVIDIPTLSQLQNAKMSSVERMSPLDLLKTNLTNLDPLTENYDLGFYLNYLNKWPSLFSTVKDRDAGIVGYSMLYSTSDCLNSTSENTLTDIYSSQKSWASSKSNTHPCETPSITHRGTVTSPC
jgi:hypothetical protein